jgi:hypothetical protein
MLLVVGCFVQRSLNLITISSYPLWLLDMLSPGVKHSPCSLRTHALKLKNTTRILFLLHLFLANSSGFYMLENIS